MLQEPRTGKNSMKRYSDAARRWSPAGACVVICLLVATVRVPGDEPLTGKPSWRLGRSDCEYLVERHEPIGPVGEDEIRLRAGPGTFLYVRQPVAPARILDDLRLSVRIRADRAGLQLFGRVVVPDAVDPETGEPASVLVPGTMYRAGTQWQELVVDRFPMQLERQLRVLRARLRAPVSARGAFLSEAVINVFGGPGTTQIRLGSAKLIGVVPPAGGGQAIAEPSLA